MPCWTIQQSKVEFLASSTDMELLAAALQRIGYGVDRVSESELLLTKEGTSGRYDAQTGRLELAPGWDVNELKRGYSEEVVNSQARMFGWQIQWTTNAAGHRQAVTQRRG
ncbi:MAG: hypothetical protein ACYDDI_11390 [Candidatus Acidiferrales bacterium]